MNYIIERLKEPSTWRGLIMILTGVFGYHLSDTAQTTVVSVGVMLSGVVGSVLPDSVKK